MGAWIKCKKCNKTYRYDSDEIENKGVAWHPIWAVKCHNCGCEIKFNQGKVEPPEIKAFNRPTGHERAQSGDIMEYWVQKYVKENYKRLGFSKIEGPFEAGPDFKGMYKGKKAVVEVERTCEQFVKHGHHKDPRFCDVNILIALSLLKPAEEIRDKLPKKIIWINVDDFIEWWRPKAKTYAEAKKVQLILDLIAGEFQKRFIENCGDKDRDMATCPECDLCAYLEEGIDFHEMALKFITLYKYPITSEDFKLNDIKRSEIDKFYVKSVAAFSIKIDIKSW